ncbi:phage tail assembly protein [Lonepinella sp. BR2919]|uniref:phage tail assembly protein n=1 Tax=unclassified Lonepinella TaxID=2642006 RepID=UPI003F6E02D5
MTKKTSTDIVLKDATFNEKQTDRPTSAIITLANPIMRGDNAFYEIRVSKPNVNALKGLKLMDVWNADVNTYMQLLPRVTQPMLHKADFETMEVFDFNELSIAVINFLAPNSVKREQEELLEVTE